MSDQIRPGPLPIDSETGMAICPPPMHIELIKVKKVFEECMHTQVEEVPITGWSPCTTQATEARCVRAWVVPNSIDCSIPAPGLVRVKFDLKVRCRVPLDTGGFDQKDEIVPDITKTFRLSRAGEKGLEQQCHVFPECMFCYIADRNPETHAVTTVICCVGILILIKLDAEVQLLIPTYGYPPPPPECEQIVDGCPSEYIPDWPPYPPHPPYSPCRDEDGNNNGCKGCR